MAPARFEPNAEGLKAMGREAADAFNAKMQPVMDHIHEQHAGQPVDQVREALKTAWRQAASKDLPEPMLTNIATQISQGNRVVLRNAG